MDQPAVPQYKFSHFRHRPHNTLFGSNLEQITYNEQLKIRTLNLDECENEAQKYEAPRIRVKPSLLPPATEAADQVREKLQKSYEEKKRRVQEYEARLKQTDDRIKEMMKQTRYVHPLDSIPNPTSDAIKKDCAGERQPIRPEIIHKHRRKPQGEHTYALIGDLLHPGQDFGMSRPVVVTNNNCLTRTDRGTHSKANYSRQMRQMITDNMPAAEHTIDSSGLTIPANLHHFYGSKVVDQLLSDKEQVNSTLERIQAADKKYRSRNVDKPEMFVKPMGNKMCQENGRGEINYQRAASPNYEGMGNLMRSNIFGPAASKHQYTIESQKVHNESVLQKRDEDMPHQYGYKTDEFKKWVEAHNTQNRIMREIDQKNLEAKG